MSIAKLRTIFEFVLLKNVNLKIRLNFKVILQKVTFWSVFE